MNRKFITPLLAAIFLSGFSISTPAQVQEIPYNQGSAAAWQALQKLRTTATVLFTQAHPDDEDAGLVTWVSRHEGARTGILSINRGEGGANLIGPEQYDALGVLRTEEFLAACRYYGADLMFTRMADFGYSKRLDETLEHWGKENVLRDMVFAVRTYKPDIIISRFHGKARDGHGNHQAAGMLSYEVFKAAADPKMFPDAGTPWQVKKMYLIPRGNEPSTLKINTGEYDPLLGKSYRQIGSEGYGMHRSQAMGQPRIPAGDFFSTLQLVESAIPKIENEKSIFDGIDMTMTGVAGTDLKLRQALLQVQNSVEIAIKQFDGNKPWGIVPHLVEGSRQLQEIMESLIDAREQVSSSAEFTKLFDLRESNIPQAQKEKELGELEKIIQQKNKAENLLNLQMNLLNEKSSGFNDAVNKSLGVTLEALVEPDKAATNPMGFMQARETIRVAVPDQPFKISVTITNRSPLNITATGFELDHSFIPFKAMPLDHPDAAKDVIEDPIGGRVEDEVEWKKVLKQNESATRRFRINHLSFDPHSIIYWSRASEVRDHRYERVGGEVDPSLPYSRPEFSCSGGYEINGVPFGLSTPIKASYVQQPNGEQRRTLTAAPTLNVQMTPRVGVVSLSSTNSETMVNVSVSSNSKGKADGVVRLKTPEGWTVIPAQKPFSFTREGEKSNFTFKVKMPKLSANQEYKIQAVAALNINPTFNPNFQEYTEGYEVIAHRDLEPRHLYRNATMEMRGVDFQVAPNLNVGYVMGVGDKVPEALAQMGVKVSMLGANELATGNLDQFDAVIIGIRASAVREDLKAYNKRLLEYCERGGNLIWQYQTPEFDEAAYGPYPYKMGRNPEEVSEENSKVTMLDATNPIFNFPNKISEKDFDGWVEERGSKWWGEWDARYKPLLESHDREQPLQRGGMMYAEYGKGTWVYAGYAFYRQLPAGVEGAYKLFANLISLKKRTR